MAHDALLPFQMTCLTCQSQAVWLRIILEGRFAPYLVARCEGCGREAIMANRAAVAAYVNDPNLFRIPFPYIEPVKE